MARQRRYTKDSARKPSGRKPIPRPLSPPPAGTSAFVREGSEAVVYHIPTSASVPASSSGDTDPVLKTTIVLPAHSTWTSGLHFHSRHTEYLRLIRGCMHVRLDSQSNIISAAAGGQVDHQGRLNSPGVVIKVEKGVRHNWGRADFMSRREITYVKKELPADYGDEVVVEEWTDPSDIEKALFFWNLNGVVVAHAERPASTRAKAVRWALGSWWIPFQLFVIFWELDNWPVIVNLNDVFVESIVGATFGRWLEQGAEWCISFTVLFCVSLVARLVGIRAVVEERTPTKLWEAWMSKGVRSKKRI